MKGLGGRSQFVENRDGMLFLKLIKTPLKGRRAGDVDQRGAVLAGQA